MTSQPHIFDEYEVAMHMVSTQWSVLGVVPYSDNDTWLRLHDAYISVIMRNT